MAYVRAAQNDKMLPLVSYPIIFILFGDRDWNR